MAFDSLTEKLQEVFKKLRTKGRLTKEDVKEALKEIKRALLAADVNFKVVKDFIKNVQERAVGQEVMNGLNPAQTVIKIVREELTGLLGTKGEELEFQAGSAVTVVMLAGLQGAGKTTTAAKLAGKYKLKGKKPLLAACDVYRPAAAEQLKINAEKQGVDFFSIGEGHKPEDIARAAVSHAKKSGARMVVLDTAGRLHIDEEMMSELERIKEAAGVHQTILVIDAMTGQDAVNTAEEFHNRIGIDGVILTKLDGDARGGAALSVRAATGRPILFVGMGEKLSDLEKFYPERMASRILGMGDVLSFIEKAEAELDGEQAREMSRKMKKAQFDFDDFLESARQMKKLGGLSGIMGMLPAGLMGGKGIRLDDGQAREAERSISRMEAMIHSMTPRERGNPDILNLSRKRRIARGAGVDIGEVNRMVKQFAEMKRMMKAVGKGGKRGAFKFPF